MRLRKQLWGFLAVLTGLLGSTAPTASAQTVAADQVGLLVNPATGEIRLIGNAGDPAELANYQITSPSASLNAAAWNSLADQGTLGFIEIAQTDASVTETSFGGFTQIDATGRSLGLLFRTAGSQDLQFLYGESDGGVATSTVGQVTYVPEPASLALLALLTLPPLARRRPRH